MVLLLKPWGHTCIEQLCNFTHLYIYNPIAFFHQVHCFWNLSSLSALTLSGNYSSHQPGQVRLQYDCSGWCTDAFAVFCTHLRDPHIPSSLAVFPRVGLRYDVQARKCSCVHIFGVRNFEKIFLDDSYLMHILPWKKSTSSLQTSLRVTREHIPTPV